MHTLRATSSLTSIHALLGTLLLAALLAGCSGLGMLGGLVGNQIRITPSMLQQQLDRKFPRDYDKLGGLVSVTLANPRVGISAGGRQLDLAFDYGIGALGSSGTPSGHFSLTTGLRYDPATRGLHFDQPRLGTLVAPGGGMLAEGAARALIDRWLADYAEREPVYRFDEDLIDRIGARRIETATIQDGAVVVRLEP